MRDTLDELPEHQADVLRSALGIGPGEEGDRFSVGAATLSLLAASAEANPGLRPRRRCAVAGPGVAGRAGLRHEAPSGGPRCPLLRSARWRGAALRGGRASSRSPSRACRARRRRDLLRRPDATALAPEVADRLYEATHGNPLALLELPGLLSTEQLAGTASLSDPLPAGSTVERAFARRTEALPESSQKALVVAAVSSSSDAEVIVAGLVGLGLPAEALEPAEDAGLVRIVDGRLEFRHPLVRSAVFHGAPASDRRSAHRALAEGLARFARSQRRGRGTWQARRSARTRRRPTALAQAAEHARRRGGYAAAAAALERAARLSPDPKLGDRAARRGRRRRLASRAHRSGVRCSCERRSPVPPTAASGPRRFGFRARSSSSRATAKRPRRPSSRPSRCSSETDPSAAVAAAADAVNALVRRPRSGSSRSRPRPRRGRSLRRTVARPTPRRRSHSDTPSASRAVTATPSHISAARSSSSEREDERPELPPGRPALGRPRLAGPA